MKRIRIVSFTILLVVGLHLWNTAPADAHILAVADGKVVSLEEVIDDLKGVRLVFMGELHDHPGHHMAQLQVIRALHDAGVPVAIGLEMFRTDSQKALDMWVAGRISERRFLRTYSDNWSMWPEYREIFHEARGRKIPMVGLNISRKITQQVARSGFASLSPKEVGQLPGKVRCDVDQEYKEYIRRVLGGHAHNNSTFDNFCEAQLLWDTVMADALLGFLATHPEHTVVVLAGSGHAWKYGIPEQIRREAEVPYRVLLPEIPGRVEAGSITAAETDYLMLGLEEAPLH
jgi:uncharacterized iron-regulated protein